MGINQRTQGVFLNNMLNALHHSPGNRTARRDVFIYRTDQCLWRGA